MNANYVRLNVLKIPYNIHYTYIFWSKDVQHLYNLNINTYYKRRYTYMCNVDTIHPHWVPYATDYVLVHIHLKLKNIKLN